MVDGRAEGFLDVADARGGLGWGDGEGGGGGGQDCCVGFGRGLSFGGEMGGEVELGTYGDAGRKVGWPLLEDGGDGLCVLMGGGGCCLVGSVSVCW